MRVRRRRARLKVGGCIRRAAQKKMRMSPLCLRRARVRNKGFNLPCCALASVLHAASAYFFRRHGG